MSWPATLGTFLALALLGGCGGDDSNEDRYDGEKARVAKVIDELSAAAREGDGQTICSELFTRNLAISVARASKQPCAAEVTENVFAEEAAYAVQDLGLTGRQAVVRVTDEKDRRSTLLLQKEKGRWLIARVG